MYHTSLLTVYYLKNTVLKTARYVLVYMSLAETSYHLMKGNRRHPCTVCIPDSRY